MTARHSDEIRLWMIGRTALLVALLTPLSLHAQSTYSAYESATATPAFSVQSPYSSPSKTRQLLNTILREWLGPGVAGSGSAREWPGSGTRECSPGVVRECY